MTEQIACKRCTQLEKHGIKRRNVFYNESEYCIQCTQEKVGKKRKQKILDENLIKTLNLIKQNYGGKK
jgi:hypothetical protein